MSTFQASLGSSVKYKTQPGATGSTFHPCSRVYSGSNFHTQLTLPMLHSREPPSRYGMCVYLRKAIQAIMQSKVCLMACTTIDASICLAWPSLASLSMQSSALSSCNVLKVDGCWNVSNFAVSICCCIHTNGKLQAYACLLKLCALGW